jgi:hypothetical protein
MILQDPLPHADVPPDIGIKRRDLKMIYEYRQRRDGNEPEQCQQFRHTIAEQSHARETINLARGPGVIC